MTNQREHCKIDCSIRVFILCMFYQNLVWTSLVPLMNFFVMEHTGVQGPTAAIACLYNNYKVLRMIQCSYHCIPSEGSLLRIQHFGCNVWKII